MQLGVFYYPVFSYACKYRVCVFKIIMVDNMVTFAHIGHKMMSYLEQNRLYKNTEIIECKLEYDTRDPPMKDAMLVTQYFGKLG